MAASALLADSIISAGALSKKLDVHKSVIRRWCDASVETTISLAHLLRMCDRAPRAARAIALEMLRRCANREAADTAFAMVKLAEELEAK